MQRVKNLHLTLCLFLFRVVTGIFSFKFLNSPGRVDIFHGAGIKRMGGTTNIKAVYWVFVSIFPRNSVVGVNGRLCEKRIVRRFVLKHHRSIILRMNAFFHRTPSSKHVLVYSHFRHYHTRKSLVIPSLPQEVPQEDLS